MSMVPIVVAPFIYVLLLEQDKYYVGITYNLNMRYSQHLQGFGANWTKKYKPINIIEIIYNPTITENEKTIQIMRKYDICNVRGGNYCKLTFSPKTLNRLQMLVEDVNINLYY